MRSEQILWWKPARSDFELFEQLRRYGAAECHLLHYLQMSTEKLSKSYLWRKGKTLPKVHTGFPKFLRALLDRSSNELSRISALLGFRQASQLDQWVTSVLPLAYQIQNLAPSEARDGPNPEYPWPHLQPEYSPIDYSFPLWIELSNTGKGRKLLNFTETVIAKFEQIA